MTFIEKKEILRVFVRKFEGEIEAIQTSAKAAHEAATHEESKSEDRHDTRGVEASYLAGAQAARAAELQKIVLEYKSLLDSQSKPSDRVAAGALVCFLPLVGEGGKPKGEPITSLVAVRGGGTAIEWKGKGISVLTPTSPLGEAALGAGVGEEVRIESKAGARFYRIDSVT
jgi:transcription elongation GreA/GreB family factor